LSGTLGAEASFSALERLYQADAGDLMEVISQTSAGVTTLMYVGHNPAAAELAGLLTGTEPHFPTAAIAVIGIAASWPGLTPGGGELLASWTPAGGEGQGAGPADG